MGIPTKMNSPGAAAAVVASDYLQTSNQIHPAATQSFKSKKERTPR
jgi:hypothetical protein